MSSNPSYQQLGFEAMNACFFGGGSSMIGSEAAPFFYPSTALDASFFSGDPVAFGGGADVAAHFMASNNAMVTSPANQLVWAAAAPSPASMSTEEMNDDAYAVVPGESCSTVHSLLPPAAAATSPEFFQYGPSDVTELLDILLACQVSNWFINARVRLWKPTIEEMYEELKRSSGGSKVEHLTKEDVVVVT